MLVVWNGPGSGSKNLAKEAKNGRFRTAKNGRSQNGFAAPKAAREVVALNIRSFAAVTGGAQKDQVEFEAGVGDQQGAGRSEAVRVVGTDCGRGGIADMRVHMRVAGVVAGDGVASLEGVARSGTG
jgi:hypothetical protein